MAYTIVPASGTSAAIVSLSATPPVRSTAGQGGLTTVREITGSATAPINMPTTNFLPLVRIPTNAIVKKVELILDSTPSTSLTGSLGLTFSNVLDGTSPPNLSVYALTGAVPAIVSQSFFVQATAIQTYTGLYKDVTFSAFANGASATDGVYVPSASNQPLWQALSAGGIGGTGKATSGAAPGAFTTCQSDPGGFFDVVWFETTTGVNTGAIVMTCRVTYTGVAG